MRELLHDLVLPGTDADVAAQLLIALCVLAIALRRTWRDRDLRIFTAGVGVFLLALMMLRALH